MAEPTIAALDLGSNTFRLMLAKREGALWAEKKVYQHIPRLSERLQPGGLFAPEALSRAWEALDDFAGLIKSAGAEKVAASATMAARIAQDGRQFIEAIKKRYGWEATIISGDEEAHLTASGVLSGLNPLPKESLIFDIGGRSTEFVSAQGPQIIKGRSLAIGVVALTEEFLASPSTNQQLEALTRHSTAILAQADFSDAPAGSTLVGAAGTVTTVAALVLNLAEYRPELINNSLLNRDKISELINLLAPKTVEQRVSDHGLHPRRADAIVAGLVLIRVILDFFGRDNLLVSDNGLLEGLWLKSAGLR